MAVLRPNPDTGLGELEFEQERRSVQEILNAVESVSRVAMARADYLPEEKLLWAAAVFGHAPSLSPSCFAHPWSEYLARFERLGLDGLVQRAQAQEALLDYSFALPEERSPDALSQALRRLLARNARATHRLRARLLLAALKAELEALLTIPDTPAQ